MQSSGASLLAFLLSREPETLAIVDCWGGVVPDFANYAGDIVLKTTVKTDVDFAQHVEAFKPDFSVLVKRNILEVRFPGDQPLPRRRGRVRSQTARRQASEAAMEF
jgi:hypothetical protein